MIDLGLSPVRTTLDLPMWLISVYHQYEHFSICQRFISVYCQYVFLSGACATTDVGRTFRREFTLVREVRTTAVSRRLRKTDWCFYSVFVFQSTHSFSVIIGLALCACIFGVSCMAPLPKEYSHALAVCCPFASVDVQYQQSLVSSGNGSPPHFSMMGVTTALAAYSSRICATLGI